jgi:uncharacterized membrane protein YgcG
MRQTLSRYMMTLLCMLAAGTWILPVHTLAAPAAPIDDGDEIVSLLTLRDAIEAMRLAGEFDRAPFAFDGADLTGDGVAETIEVFPPQRLETPGAMRVVDGATGAERYTLRAPAGEMGFGEHCAVVSDCDEDGILDIGVLSWLEAGGDPSSALMELRMRVFSGASGELVGLLHTVREVGSALSPTDLSVVVAGDANADGFLDVADVVNASAALTSSAALVPSIDCKMDGGITLEDFTTVIERVIEEPQAQRAALYSVALRELEIAAPIAPPGSGGDPSQTGGGGAGGGGGGGGGGAGGGGGGAGGGGCAVQWQGGFCWYGLGGLVIDFAWLMTAMAGCTGAHAPVCVLARICHLARFLSELLAFANSCLTNGQCLPDWLEHVSGAILVIGAICQGIEGLTKGLKDRIADLLRRIGRGLGDVRIMI